MSWRSTTLDNISVGEPARGSALDPAKGNSNSYPLLPSGATDRLGHDIDHDFACRSVFAGMAFENLLKWRWLSAPCPQTP